MRIFDRYVVREVALPLLLSLVLLTFLATIQPFLKQAYPIIAQGVDAWIVVKVVVFLLPQALSISIPMAVLLGLLIALGRMSADREFVAMQACGVSIYQLLRPLIAIAAVSTAATAYVMIVASEGGGASTYQLLRPLIPIAAVSTAASAYVMTVARPDWNQAFRELVFK